MKIFTTVVFTMILLSGEAMSSTYPGEEGYDSYDFTSSPDLNSYEQNMAKHGIGQNSDILTQNEENAGHHVVSNDQYQITQDSYGSNPHGGNGYSSPHGGSGYSSPHGGSGYSSNPYGGNGYSSPHGRNRQM
jgi:hypothetical protein